MNTNAIRIGNFGLYVLRLLFCVVGLACVPSRVMADEFVHMKAIVTALGVPAGLSSANDPRFPMTLQVIGAFDAGVWQNAATCASVPGGGGVQINYNDKKLVGGGTPFLTMPFRWLGANGVVVDSWTVSSPSGDGSGDPFDAYHTTALGALPYVKSISIYNPDQVSRYFVVLDAAGNVVAGPFLVGPGGTKDVSISSDSNLGDLYIQMAASSFNTDGVPSYDLFGPKKGAGTTSTTPSTNSVVLPSTDNPTAYNAPTNFPFVSYPTNTADYGGTNSYLLQALLEQVGKMRYENTEYYDAAKKGMAAGNAAAVASSAQLTNLNTKVGNIDTKFATLLTLQSNGISNDQLALTNFKAMTNLLGMIATNDNFYVSLTNFPTNFGTFTNPVSVTITNVNTNIVNITNAFTNLLSFSNSISISNVVSVTNFTTNIFDTSNLESNQLTQIALLEALLATNGYSTNGVPATNGYSNFVASAATQGALVSNIFGTIGAGVTPPDDIVEPAGDWILHLPGGIDINYDPASNAKVAGLMGAMRSALFWLATLYFGFKILVLYRNAISEFLNQDQLKVANIAIAGFTVQNLAIYIVCALLVPSGIITLGVLLASNLTDTNVFSVVAEHPFTALQAHSEGNFALHCVMMCVPVNEIKTYFFIYLAAWFVVQATALGLRTQLKLIPG